MKRLAVLVLLLVFALTTVCFAKSFKYKAPDSTRWMKISETKQNVIWLDTKSMKLGREKKKSSDCHEHRTADIWMSYYFPEIDVEMINLEHWDLDCRTMQIKNSTYKYYKLDHVSNKDRSHESPIHVVPDTLMESIYVLLDTLWNNNDKVNKK